MDTIGIVITVALAVIGLLMGAVGYLIAHMIANYDKQNQEFRETLNKLAMSITTLNGTMLAINEKYEDHKIVCEKRFKRIDK